MNQRSRSTLFLIEQLIVVAIFAICSAACVKILTSAYFAARESKDVSNAVLIAKNAAESFKAASGDIGKVSEALGSISENSDDGNSITVYYDKEWQVCENNKAFYVFHLTVGNTDPPSSPLLSGDILVKKLTGEELMAFTVAARDHTVSQERRGG